MSVKKMKGETASIAASRSAGVTDFSTGDYLIKEVWKGTTPKEISGIAPVQGLRARRCHEARLSVFEFRREAIVGKLRVILNG
jgi:hypothetical protein